MSNDIREQPLIRHWRVATGLLVLFCALLWARGAAAQTPPQPDFFWPYGTVSLDGGNIDPAIQPVIGMVNGRVCGQGLTTIAQAGPGVPPSDVGRTVYVLDVVASGTNTGQLPGCGTPAAPVTLYFPQAQRVAFEQPPFQQGGHRYDLNLGPALIFRLQGPMVANDGLP